MSELIERLQNQPEDAFLIRIGRLKDSKRLNVSWDQIADIMNENCNTTFSESFWRKKYRKISSGLSEIENSIIDKSDEGLKKFFNDVEKERIRTRDERMAFTREMRRQARNDTILDLFKEEIKKYENKEYKIKKYEIKESSDKKIYAMLSDIHYGLSFNSPVGKYNSDIAQNRIMRYAQHIIQVGKDCNTCYVSLMGDMISGAIHQTIRVENKENVIQQVVGVSELTALFLLELSNHFEEIYVNNVDGNHSRLDPNLENVLRGEKLDALVPWYCKAKLSNIKNIHFVDNWIDDTIGSFFIDDKLYVSVHGDYEKDLKTSAINIEKMVGKHVDVMLAAHMHVSEWRFEDTLYIRNGSVCGSGDDYTMKKRLFGPAVQTCFICSANGVESIHPIVLSNDSIEVIV